MIYLERKPTCLCVTNIKDPDRLTSAAVYLRERTIPRPAHYLMAHDLLVQYGLPNCTNHPMTSSLAHLLTSEHDAFRATARRFAQQEIAPLVDAAEANGRYPVEIVRRAGDLGFLAAGYPEDVGGSGAGVSFECVLIEECAAISAGITSGLMIQSGLATALIHEYGDELQRKNYLIPALRGERLGCFAMTEPNAGSDVLSMRGRAVPDGDGYRIQCNKVFITAAPYADYLIVVVYTAPEKRQKGLSIFVVERNLAGIEMRKLDKLGHHSMETAEIDIDCKVPASALLGDAGAGMTYLLKGLEKGRITHSARSLGVARAAKDMTRTYARDRIQFGQPISTFQAIQFELARMEIEVTSAALHVYSAALKLDSGERAMAEASMAKVVASETAEHVTSRAMHIHGGYGYMAEFPIERLFRDAKLYPVTEGTTEIQLRTLARELGI